MDPRGTFGLSERRGEEKSATLGIFLDWIIKMLYEHMLSPTLVVY